MAGFIKPTRVDSKVAPFDRKMAQILYDCLLQARRMHKPYPKVEKWADDFRLLRKVSGVSAKQITLVVGWFSNHLRDKYTPKVFSANKFRRRFVEIESAMEREQANPTQLPVGEVSPEAKRIKVRLGLLWPGKEAAQALNFIHTSFVNYSRFVTGLETLRDQFQAEAETKAAQRPEGTTSSRDWHEYNLFDFLCNRVSDPVTFTEGWLNEIHRMAWKWDGWKGQLMKWVFTPESRLYRREAEPWLVEHSDDKYSWDDVLKMLSQTRTPG